MKLKHDSNLLRSHAKAHLLPFSEMSNHDLDQVNYVFFVGLEIVS